MPSVRKYRDGYRCEVYVNGKRDSQAPFRTKSDAYGWGIIREKELTVETAPPVTFGEIAEQWLAKRLPELSHPNSQHATEYTVRQFMLPALAHRPLKEIKRTELVAVVQAVAKRGTTETSHRTAQRLNKIFKYAVSCGLIDMHPAAELVDVLPERDEPEHFPCVEMQEVPDLMANIATWTDPVTQMGLQLAAHTFPRAAALTGARWSEIDFQEKVWTIPKDRMKGKKFKRQIHFVPLSRQVLSILTSLQKITGNSPYVLASTINPLCPISGNTLLFALYDLGYKGRHCVHGFRSMATTILNKNTQYPVDAIEWQMAHRARDRVRAIYLRDKYIEERIEMMQWYSDHLTTRPAVPLRAVA